MQAPIPPKVQNLIKKEFNEQTGRLVLSDAALTDIPEAIFDMEWLTELIITNGYETGNKPQKFSKKKEIARPNQIPYIPEQIVRLKNLKKLHIGNFGTSPWPINDISMLAELIALEELDLSNNQIADFSSLGALERLRFLNLNHNKIRNLSPLSNLHNLEVLDLGANSLTTAQINRDWSNFPKLRVLNLNQNVISQIDSLDNLPSLKELILDDNRIEDLSFLNRIEQLEALHLVRNKIQELAPLQKLHALKTLELGSNEISNIGSLSGLENLEVLGLSHNQINNLTPLIKLSNLKTLYLKENRITNIQPITRIPNLEEVYLNGNEISDCPPDIWGTNEIKQIRAYFSGMSREAVQQQEQVISKGIPSKKSSAKGILEVEESLTSPPPQPSRSVSDIQDIKLIFVGNSGSGKTQLSKFFEEGKLDKTRKTTHGIRLNRWLPKGKASPAFLPLKDRIAANIWDFGGQEYYHGTFRLFLSNYAVYVLIWESDTNKNEILDTEVRADEKEALQHYHYKYWLDNIRHYAPSSPILIIQNKIDKDPAQRVATQWIEEYAIANDHYISLHKAAEGEIQEFKWQFDLFCNDLVKSFTSILEEKYQQEKSTAWLQIRDEVIAVRKSGSKKTNNHFKKHLQSGKYILLEDFRKGCLEIEPELTEDELYTLPRWLHNSGVVIYFGKDEELNDKVFLDPIWVTESIYRILDETVRAADGVFTKDSIRTPKAFPKQSVLALMQEMEIIFKKQDEVDTYVAPQYLPETHPVEDLYAIAAKGLQQEAYFIRLPLYFFRKVLQRMIFFYGTSEDVDARYYWKTGILFQKRQTRLMFKGIVPNAEAEYGTFLIGAEPVGVYQAIQKEVFHIIIEILEEQELMKIAALTSNASSVKSKSESNTASDLHHRTDNWTERYLTEAPPRWLQKLEVSVDNTNFVNYLELCHANRKDEMFIQSTLQQRLKIHDFEILLDRQPKRPLKVFFSYSHKDTGIMEQLSVHLAPLKRLEKIEVWSDKAIQPGDEWDAAIEDNLRNSDIVLFLISADFIASSYIWDKEIPLATKYLQDMNERVSRIIPIYLRPFDFSGLPFTDKQMIPHNNGHLKAISQWDNIDVAFTTVAEGIRKAINGMV